MYLFTRSGRLAPGNTRDSMDWALGITEKVNKIIELDVSLYMQIFSPEFGTLGWSCFAPDLTALESATDKLLADDSFVAATDAGAKFLAGGLDDTVYQVLEGAPDPSRQVEYVTAVSAVCANGNIARGLEVGVEISQEVARITGTPGMFLANSTGVYGAVGWVTGHANVQAIDDAQTALTSDPGFMKLIDEKAGKAYSQLPSPTQTIFRRLA